MEVADERVGARLCGCDERDACAGIDQPARAVPPTAVTVCGIASLFVTVTVAPGATVSGENAKSAIVITAGVAGAAAPVGTATAAAGVERHPLAAGSRRRTAERGR